MDYLIWVGPRDTDIEFSNYFEESICYYSKNNLLSYREAHIYGAVFLKFVTSRMRKILSNHSNAKFVFYNPKIAYSLDENLRKHVVCLNQKYILELLSDKIYTRYWFGNYVPVLPSVLTDSYHLSFTDLNSKLGFSNAYVVQQNKSSGGFGTFYLTPQNQMLSKLKNSYNEVFIVSPYIAKSISVNINAIIYCKNIQLFPPSIQIVENNNNRLLYHGADYVAAQKLSSEIHQKIQNYSDIILQHIQTLGYRGIIGLDFIVTDDNVYFQEVNPRYQASSFLIDIELSAKELPSLSEMNFMAFNNYTCPEFVTQNLVIDYSFYKYLYFKGAKHVYHIANKASQNPFVYRICLDGWNERMDNEADAYCYSLVFSTNITSINFDGCIDIYSNISGEEKYINENITSQIGLKIALLNQGCIIPENTNNFLNVRGIVKKAVFSSIDFQLTNGVYINAPVNLKFTDFSPFSIQVNSNAQLELHYYDKIISELKIEMQPDWNDLVTKNNVPYGKIAYLSTDRLRIKHEAFCNFKQQGKGCAFCSIPISKTIFGKEDLEEVIDELLNTPSFRHILIGGGSGRLETEYEDIIYITELIRKKNRKIPIYLMSLPPYNINILEKYKQSGITEVAFNIEIWDRLLAQNIMPGKGQIPLNQYLETLKSATKYWGSTGNVRTALIVGLNNTEILLYGIEVLCKNGIQPMLSVFRPMPNTKLNDVVPPSNNYLLNLYNKSQEICERYGLKLGPACDACKNNMLAI